MRILILLIIIVGLMLARHLLFNTVDAPRTSLERDIMDYTAQLQLDPDDAVAHAGLGVAYMKMARLVEARAEFRKAVRFAPKSAQYRYNLAVAYRDSGEVKKALRELRVAKGLARNWDGPFFASGRIHLEQKEYKQAIRDFIVCLDMNPRNADAHFSLAAAYEAAGQTKKAAAEYRETLKYVPDYTGVRAGLKSLEKK